MEEDAGSFWTEIKRYQDMLSADPGSCCFAPLSELYRKQGLVDEAIAVASKGCDLHPDYPGGFFALGFAYNDKGLKAQARQALERVITLTPDNFRALQLLGKIYLEAGETALAKTALGQALRQNPEDQESALLLRTIASTAADQSDEEFLEEAEVIEELTDVVEELEELEELTEVVEGPTAPEQVQERKSAGRRDPLFTATLAELYVSQGFLDKALAVYRELLSADSTNQPYQLRCAELLEMKQLQQQAKSLSAPAPGPVQEVAAGLEGVEKELSSWLGNIRRRRDGV